MSKAALGSLAFVALLVAVSPVLAQDGEPVNDLGTGRTDAPTGTPPDAGPRRTGAPTGSARRTDVPVDPGDSASRSTTPPPPPAAGAADQGRAPWSWPWGGPRSPEWTQDATWAATHFWLMDVGHVELDAGWDGIVERRNYSLDQFYQAKARIGLLPHLELGVAEDVRWDDVGPKVRLAVTDPPQVRGNHVTQEGNEISARFAPWDYGTIPLNPSIEVTWRPQHNGIDQWEGRGSIGFELLPRLVLAADGFFQGETSGLHNYTWGFHAGASYELVTHVLRVGAEGGVTWQFSPDHKDPFAQTDPEVGPTVLFRPLSLIKTEVRQPAQGHAERSVRVEGRQHQRAVLQRPRGHRDPVLAHTLAPDALGQLARVGEPGLGRLRQGASDESGQRRARSRERADRVLADRASGVEDRAAAEGQLARHDLVEHGAQGKDVRPGPELFAVAVEQLGRHVAHRPEREARARELAVLAREVLRQAEVGDERSSVGAEEDVLGLQVPVDDPVLVERGERRGDLADEGERLARRERLALAEVRPERATPGELEHEVRSPGRDARVEQGDHSRERRGALEQLELARDTARPASGGAGS